MESKKYDVAFKMECIRMVEEDGLRGIDVSRKLGIHKKTIYRWLDESRTYIPIRYACESLGYAVDWDDSTRTISIY